MNSHKLPQGAAADASPEAPLRIMTDEELLLAWGGTESPSDPVYWLHH